MQNARGGCETVVRVRWNGSKLTCMSYMCKSSYILQGRSTGTNGQLLWVKKHCNTAFRVDLNLKL